MIAHLLAALAMIAGCGQRRAPGPEPAPGPHARPSPGSSRPAPPTPAGGRPADGALTWDGVAIQDELGLIPNVRLGTVSAGSGIDLTAVVDRLRSKLPVLRACFRREVTPRPHSQLTLTLSFEIDGQGQVGRADVQGTGVLALRECIASSLMGEEGFPPGPVEVEASLVVTPVRSSGGGGR